MSNKDELQESLRHLHRTLESVYSKISESTGIILENTQKIRRELPEYYRQIQEMVVGCENLAGEVDDSDNFDLDGVRDILTRLEGEAVEAESKLSDIQALISDMSDALPVQ